MRPVARAARLLAQECEGCGFRWVSYDEDWWAGLAPGLQSELIDLALDAAGQLNGRPVIIFPVAPAYRVAATAIPGRLLRARERAARRP
jgi:hypothetical protein